MGEEQLQARAADAGHAEVEVLQSGGKETLTGLFLFIERKEAVMTHLADSSCEEGAGKVESPVTEDTNTGWSTVARASRKTAQPLERT